MFLMPAGRVWNASCGGLAWGWGRNVVLTLTSASGETPGEAEFGYVLQNDFPSMGRSAWTGYGMVRSGWGPWAEV